MTNYTCTPLTYNKLLWHPSLNYLRNMPEEVISRDKFSFLVHVREKRTASFGRHKFLHIEMSQKAGSPVLPEHLAN